MSLAPATVLPLGAAGPSAGPVPFRQVHVLLNTRSGRGEPGPGGREIEDAFARHGMKIRLTRLEKGADIARIARMARRDGADLVVAAGGDGTMNAVAAALAGSGGTMGVLPMGTFNYLARSLGVPEDLDGAVAVMAKGHRRDLPVGMVNETLFLNNASFGIYPQILRERETVYARWGRSRAAAYWSVLRTMLRLPKPLKLRIIAGDRVEERDTPLAFAVANGFQLRHLGLEGDAEIAAGRIALLIAPNVSRARLLWNGISLMLGRAARDREFELIGASEITIEARRKSLLVARDGERSRLHGPYKVRLRRDALQVAVPAPDADPVAKQAPDGAA